MCKTAKGEPSEEYENSACHISQPDLTVVTEIPAILLCTVAADGCKRSHCYGHEQGQILRKWGQIHWNSQILREWGHISVGNL